jgi:RHS repeat-associated protein
MTQPGVGNRDWVKVDGVETDYASNSLNQYTSVGGVSKTYDDNGNLTDDHEKWKLYYDYKDRLVKVTDRSEMPQTIAEYSYDCFGRRISSTVYFPGYYTMNYYYEGASIIEERDASGAMTKQYIYGSGIDEVLVMINSSGEKYYYHTNSLGSVTELSDSTGAVVEHYTYDAYGKPSIFDANWNPRNYSFIYNRFMFTGREYDSETGFYYYRARYYDPATGRFLQRDPKGYHDSMCLYQYCKANPVNYLDPYGWQAKEEKKEEPVGKSYNEKQVAEAVSLIEKGREGPINVLFKKRNDYNQKINRIRSDIAALREDDKKGIANLQADIEQLSKDRSAVEAQIQGQIGEYIGSLAEMQKGIGHCIAIVERDIAKVMSQVTEALNKANAAGKLEKEYAKVAQMALCGRNPIKCLVALHEMNKWAQQIWADKAVADQYQQVVDRLYSEIVWIKDLSKEDLEALRGCDIPPSMKEVLKSKEKEWKQIQQEFTNVVSNEKVTGEVVDYGAETPPLKR